MTRSNPYQIIDSLLAEIDKLTAHVAELEQTIASFEDVSQPQPSTVNSDPLTASAAPADADFDFDLSRNSKGVTTFINPDHPFAIDCQSNRVTILKEGKETSIVAEALDLIKGQCLHTAEVNNNCLLYFNCDYLNFSQSVSASSLLPDGNTELDEFAVDLEEEDLTEESIVSLVFDDLTPKPEADKLKSLVLELDRALNKVSCLKDDKEAMLKAVYIELLGSDFKDNDDYDRRYKLFRSAISSSVEAMKFDIIRRMKK